METVHRTQPSRTKRVRNDPTIYDELASCWWDRRGPFALLHWLAAARALAIPEAATCDGLLVDLGCGGGLLAPYALSKGYRYLGLDLSRPGLLLAQEHGAVPLRVDLRALPLCDQCADVVVAGEVLEHVTPHDAVLDEACRILRPGGTLLLDTMANTLLARLLIVELAERVRGAAPAGIHDPRLFVDRKQLRQRASDNGVELTLRGLRPDLRQMTQYVRHRRDDVTLVPTRSTAVLFQAIGTKRH